MKYVIFSPLGLGISFSPGNIRGGRTCFHSWTRHAQIPLDAKRRHSSLPPPPFLNSSSTFRAQQDLGKSAGPRFHFSTCESQGLGARRDGRWNCETGNENQHADVLFFFFPTLDKLIIQSKKLANVTATFRTCYAEWRKGGKRGPRLLSRQRVNALLHCSL